MNRFVRGFLCRQRGLRTVLPESEGQGILTRHGLGEMPALDDVDAELSHQTVLLGILHALRDDGVTKGAAQAGQHRRQMLDADDLALIANPSNWRGRDARLWRIVRDASNAQQGGFHAYYTGKIVGLAHAGSAQGQVIRVTIESYLSVFGAPSNRTYLDQEKYDSGDVSARASIAIANGNYSGAGLGGSGSRGGGGGRELAT